MPVYHPNTRFSDCWGSAGDVTFYHRDGVCYWRSRDRHSFGGTSAQFKALDVHRRALTEQLIKIERIVKIRFMLAHFFFFSFQTWNNSKTVANTIALTR